METMFPVIKLVDVKELDPFEDPELLLDFVLEDLRDPTPAELNPCVAEEKPYCCCDELVNGLSKIDVMRSSVFELS